MTTDIYLGEAVSVRTRRRCYRINVENPSVGNKEITFYQQDLTEDSNGNELASKQSESLAFDINGIVMDIIEIADPVTGLTTHISGAAIAMWLEAEYVLKVQASLAPPPPVIPPVIPPVDPPVDPPADTPPTDPANPPV